MKNIFCGLACSILTSCTYTPKNPQDWMEFQQNACLPTAIIYKKHLEKNNIWSKVIVYNYHNKNIGHAIAAYMYPPGENKLWTYDYLGSYKAKAYKYNPLQIAKEAERARDRDAKKVNSAYFLD